MRIFNNVVEAVSEVKRDLAEMGSIVKIRTMQDKKVDVDEGLSTTKELQAYSFCILNSSDKDAVVSNLDWCKADFLERISDKRINPGSAYKLRKEVWKEFKKDGRFSYTYNERLQTQITHVMDILTNDEGSRQALIQVYDRYKDHKNVGGKARIPCSLFYQLQIRNDALDIIYSMRSCDVFQHFTYDIWMACELRDHIAKKLALKPGKFFMFVSSLHGYKKDMEGIF